MFLLTLIFPGPPLPVPHTQGPVITDAPSEGGKSLLDLEYLMLREGWQSDCELTRARHQTLSRATWKGTVCKVAVLMGIPRP